MAAGSTYTPIATQTLASPATVVNFTSISSSYTDLILVCQDITSTGGTIEGIAVQVGNGSIDTGSNYSRTTLDGYTSATSGRSTNATSLDLGVIDNNTVGTSVYQFMNYANTTTYKTILSRSGPSTYVRTAVGLWRSTSAINAIKLSKTYNWAAGSTFTLYGIAAA